MALLKRAGNFFALDIGTNAVRVVQLTRAGQDSWTLAHYGHAPLDPKIAVSDSPEARTKVGEVIMTAVGQSGITDRDVVIGLPSQKTFTTVIDVPTMSEAELKSTIKYQIDKFIPMSLDDAKVDWKLLGPSMHDPKQLEVLLASTAKSYSESRLEMIENLGLNVVAAEPDPIAMIRSLLPVNASDGLMIVDMGEQSTDIALTYSNSPRLVRTIPVGLNTLVKAAVQNLNVKDEQARQFILKFGLAPDRLEGQVYRAVEATLENFSTELMKSIKFFQTRYPNIPVSGILLSGYATTIPRLSEFITTKSGIQASPANPWQKVTISPADQQQLLPIMNEFATVVGLAQRSNTL